MEFATFHLRSRVIPPLSGKSKIELVRRKETSAVNIVEDSDTGQKTSKDLVGGRVASQAWTTLTSVDIINASLQADYQL
jgi:hypothetical protein